MPLITRTLLFLFCLILGMASLYAQLSSDAPVSELQRKFLRMEQRALELSQKLSEMSGTEPIQLIERNESLEPIELETDAQLSFDELPGPAIEPLPLPVEETEPELPTVYKSEVHRVVPTTQQRKGDYYLMPLIGFAISSSTNFSQDNLNDELDGEWGNSVGLTAGKRWDNWTANIRVAYQYTKNKNLDFKNSTNNKYRVYGIEESFALSCGGGYNISLNNRLSTYGLINGGLAWRRNNADVEIKWLNQWRDDPNSASESSLVFTYDFSMGLEYLFTQNYSARLGYRLLGLTSNESFEGSFQHLIELGVGANF